MSDELPSDLELARGAVLGNEDSWKRIYENTCDRLFSLLCFQIGDREEALDLLQETYLRAFRRLGQYRGDAPLAAWLRTIALRRATDWKRVHLRRLGRRVPLTEAAAAIEPEPERIPSESESLELRRALSRLSGRQRAVLLLREYEERSFSEIAGILGMNESTARVHYTRARERLRLALTRRVVCQGAGDWEGQRT
jgi:RNA polymerase sigma factor (sigma-70 family)